MTNAGRGTFDSIVHGIDVLADVGYPIDGIAVTVNEHNFPYLDESIVEWAATRAMKEVRIDIDVVGMVNIPVEEIVVRLMRIRRFARERGIEIAGFWSRPAENLNEPTLENRVSFCGAVRGNSMCVSPAGRIYACGYSTTQLGDIAAISSFSDPDNPYHRFVRDHQTGTMEMCRGCMIEGSCAGGCNITHEFARATGTPKIERMCDFYRSMTTVLLLEQMREGLSVPEESMEGLIQ